MLLSLCHPLGGKNHAGFDALGKLGPKQPYIRDVKIEACRAGPVRGSRLSCRRLATLGKLD